MSNRVCLIDLPGLSRELLAAVPKDSLLGRWLATRQVARLTPSLPAVTCSVQATLTTGVRPSKHGIIANGLPTFRSAEDQALVDSANFVEYRRQISFWEQSNQFVQKPRFWQHPDGSSKYRTAMLFFQHCIPGFTGDKKPAADIVLTPKPDHGPDGKLTSLCWSNPPELVPQLFGKLGPLPLMNYWGPMAGIASSQWIAKAAALVWREQQPQLQLTYVPHLDYDLQRYGPDSAQAIKAVIDVTAALEPLIEAAQADGARLVLLSEYAIKPVNRAIFPNRLLREAGLLQTRTATDGVLIDYEKSQAVAMVDHQVAHVYLKSVEDIQRAQSILQATGAMIYHRHQLADLGLDHRRSGDLVLIAPPDAWFDYRWWTQPDQAPVFARTVDIHRKPGYDPLELFFDPVARGIVQDESKVRGSHGAVMPGEAVLIGDFDVVPAEVQADEVANLVEALLR